MHTKLIAVGTPDGLRGAVSNSTGSSSTGSSGTGSGPATAIQLTVVTGAVVAAARRASGADVAVSGNTITIGVGKPERDNPGLVKAVVAAGGEIQFVSGTVPTLEETYLKLLARDYEHSEKSQPTDQPAPARQ
jgi:ABC-2 type transport system ATP-binding protein